MSKLIKATILLAGILLAAPSYGSTSIPWVPATDDLIVSEESYTVVRVIGPQAERIAYECKCRWFFSEDCKTLFLLDIPENVCI